MNDANPNEQTADPYPEALAHTLRKIPIAPVILTVLFLLSLVLITDQWWRLWGVLVVLLGLFAARRTLDDARRPARSRVALFFVVVLLVHAALAALTGGIASPLLVVWGAIMVVAAFAIGPSPELKWVVSIPVSTILLLTAAGLLPWPALEFLHLHESRWFIVSAGCLALLMSIATAMIGAKVRRDQETLRASAEAAQEAQEAGLRERNRALHQLTQTLAHELKNPLSAVLALSTAMEENARQTSQSQAAQLAVIAGEARRMRKIINELLDYSRPVELQLSEFELWPMLEELRTAHWGLANDKKISIELRGDRGVKLRADRDKLSQVFTNLVQNALEASPENGTIEIESNPLEPGEVELLFKDEGPGLSLEVSEQLFSPGVTTKPRGSGLGLAISKRIVSTHGGLITVTNREGRGCVSAVRLPSKSSQ